MQRFETHICLVCQNEEFNITPTLHADFKPRNVLLIYTSWHKQKALNLAEIFNRYHIKSRIMTCLKYQEHP